MTEFAGATTYFTITTAILENDSVGNVLKGNLQTMAQDVAFEVIIMGASHARKYALTRCKMYTPLGKLQDAIKTVLYNNNKFVGLKPGSPELAKIEQDRTKVMADATKAAGEIDATFMEPVIPGKPSRRVARDRVAAAR